MHLEPAEKRWEDADTSAKSTSIAKPVERQQRKISDLKEARTLEALRIAAAAGWPDGLPDEVRREVRRKGMGPAIGIISFCYLFVLPISYFGGPFLVGAILLGMALATLLVRRLPKPPNPYGFEPGAYRPDPANEKERLVLDYLSRQTRPNALFVFLACAAPAVLALFLGVGFSQGIFNLASYAGGIWEKAVSISLATAAAIMFAFAPAAAAYWANFYRRVTRP